MQNSLKDLTRQHRGSGFRILVDGPVQIPTNWQKFLSNDENKTMLFKFLANLIVQIDSEKIIISTLEDLAISNTNTALENLSPCNHEEADYAGHNAFG